MTADTQTLNKGPKSFDKSQAKTAVNALLKYVNKKKKEALFMDAQIRFLLDITAFKTPTGKHQYYNIVLPNSPFASALDSLDILLVVRDMKGVEPEHVIGQVKDELRNSDNTRNKLKVRQIMTLKQLQDDYSTYEAKRALSKSVDVVIVERNLFKMMPTLLGREFQKKKKFHLQIPGREFKDKDLGEQIMYALTKTVLHVSMKGQTSTIVVGQDNLNSEELASNISKVAYWLKRKFPGGWKNIQKLALHTGDSGMPPLVIYFSSGSANDVKKPPVTKGSSIPDAIEGELSTQPGSHIKVHATGEIQVFQRKNMSKEDKDIVNALKDTPLKRRKVKDMKNIKKLNKKFKKEPEVKDEVKEEDSGNEDDDEDEEDLDEDEVKSEDEEEQQEAISEEEQEEYNSDEVEDEDE